jgi:hypothetical protein
MALSALMHSKRVNVLSKFIENINLIFIFVFKGDLVKFGECISRHRKQKLIMAPGSEPDAVKKLTEKIEPFVYGYYFILFYSFKKSFIVRKQ